VAEKGVRRNSAFGGGRTSVALWACPTSTKMKAAVKCILEVALTLTKKKKIKKARLNALRKNYGSQ